MCCISGFRPWIEKNIIEPNTQNQGPKSFDDLMEAISKGKLHGVKKKDLEDTQCVRTTARLNAMISTIALIASAALVALFLTAVLAMTTLTIGVISAVGGLAVICAIAARCMHNRYQKEMQIFAAHASQYLYTPQLAFQHKHDSDDDVDSSDDDDSSNSPQKRLQAEPRTSQTISRKRIKGQSTDDSKPASPHVQFNLNSQGIVSAGTSMQDSTEIHAATKKYRATGGKDGKKLDHVPSARMRGYKLHLPPAVIQLLTDHLGQDQSSWPWSKASEQPLGISLYRKNDSEMIIRIITTEQEEEFSFSHKCITSQHSTDEAIQELTTLLQTIKK